MKQKTVIALSVVTTLTIALGLSACEGGGAQPLQSALPAPPTLAQQTDRLERA